MQPVNDVLPTTVSSSFLTSQVQEESVQGTKVLLRLTPTGYDTFEEHPYEGIIVPLEPRSTILLCKV